MKYEEYKQLEKWLDLLKIPVVKSNKFYKSSNGMNSFSVSGVIKNDAK